MALFTEIERDRVRDWVLQLARGDSRIVAGAVVGSVALGRGDRSNAKSCCARSPRSSRRSCAKAPRFARWADKLAPQLRDLMGEWDRGSA